MSDAEQAVGTTIKDIYKTETAYFDHEFPIILDRYGEKETCYFNFVYHLLKAGNQVTGIIAVATDVTANFIAKRALKKMNND